MEIIINIKGIPFSESKAIVISSCSPGYAGMSKLRNSASSSSLLLGNANLASTNLTPYLPARLKHSKISVPLTTKLRHFPWLKSCKNARNCMTFSCWMIWIRAVLVSHFLYIGTTILLRDIANRDAGLNRKKSQPFVSMVESFTDLYWRKYRRIAYPSNRTLNPVIAYWNLCRSSHMSEKADYMITSINWREANLGERQSHISSQTGWSWPFVANLPLSQVSL